MNIDTGNSTRLTEMRSDMIHRASRWGCRRNISCAHERIGSRRHGRTQPAPPTFEQLTEVGRGVAGSPGTGTRFLQEHHAIRQQRPVGQLTFGDLPCAGTIQSIGLFARRAMPSWPAFGRQRTPAAHDGRNPSRPSNAKSSTTLASRVQARCALHTPEHAPDGP
jgi:hypothetical protein